eukprot:scaffold20525_cov67-Phaeocystis_antarctica.AAC.1
MSRAPSRSSALTTCSSSPRSEKRRRREAGRGAPFSTNKPSGRASRMFGGKVALFAPRRLFPRWHSSRQVFWISSKSSVASVSFSLRFSNEHSLSELCTAPCKGVCGARARCCVRARGCARASRARSRASSLPQLAAPRELGRTTTRQDLVNSSPRTRLHI